jgi:hypothetical protein
LIHPGIDAVEQVFLRQGEHEARRASRFDWSPTGAREHRRGSLDDHTPLPRGWARDAYEAVVPLIWPLALDGLAPALPDGRVDGWRVEERMPVALERVVGRVPPETQEAFLAAIGRPFEHDVVGPIRRGCQCRFCRPAARLLAALDKVPRVQRLREAFEDALADHLDLVLKASNAYDRRLGAPRATWRTPGRHGGDDDE